LVLTLDYLVKKEMLVLIANKTNLFYSNFKVLFFIKKDERGATQKLFTRSFIIILLSLKYV